MFYDLSIPWTANTVELQRTLSFLADLDYSIIALNHIVDEKLPNDIVGDEWFSTICEVANVSKSCPIPDPLPFQVPTKLRILRRCTIVLLDTSQNHRLTALAAQYDILAIRPATDKALQFATQSPEADLISMDLTQRFPFYMRPKMFTPALQRGLRIELCYGTGVTGGRGGMGNSMARRQLIANATALIRATRGRGIVLSSEARRALECRAPFDVMNLATVWGLKPDRSREAISLEAKAVVASAKMRRSSYRGAVDIVDGGMGTSTKSRTPTLLGTQKTAAPPMSLRASTNSDEHNHSPKSLAGIEIESKSAVKHPKEGSQQRPAKRARQSR